MTSHSINMLRKRSSFHLLLWLTAAVLTSCSAGSDTQVNNSNSNGNGGGNGNGSSSGQYLFAGTEHAIFRSTDSGATWMAASAGPVQHVTAFATYGNAIYASSWGGILVSSDNGLTWALSGDSMNALSIYRYGNYLIAGTAYGMRRSSDGGKTWKTQSNDYGGGSFASNGNVIIAGGYYSGVGVYRSSDSGASWIEISNGISGENLFAVACDDKFFYTGSEREGAFRSSDRGLSWSKIDINTPNVYAMISHDSSIYAATDRAVMRCINDGIVWRYLGFPTAYPESSLLFNGTNLFCGTQGAGIFRTSDNGATWKQLRTGLTDTVILSLGMK